MRHNYRSHESTRPAVLVARAGAARSSSLVGDSMRREPLLLAHFIAVFLAFLLWAPVSHSEPEAAVITVTAKLVEIPSKPPPDDLYDYAFVMRYEVIGGPLDKSILLVAHYKPLQPRSKIKGKMKEFVGGKLRSF